MPLARQPYSVTRAGLYRTKLTHPVTGAIVTLSSRSLAELMERRAHFDHVRRELQTSHKCPHCHGELVARLDAADAEKQIDAMLTEAVAGRKTTLSAAWRAYEDEAPKEHQRKLRSVWRHQIEPFLPASVTLLSLDERRMMRWLETLEKEGYAARTVRNAYWFIAACYHRAARRRLVPKTPPWGDVKPKSPRKARIRLLTPSEVAALARGLGGVGASQSARCVVFAALTGLRNGELAALGWDDIDAAEGTMTVRHASLDEWRTHYPGKTRPDFPTKSRREHTQKLHPQALDILRMQARALRAKQRLRQDGPVWPDARGNWRPNATALRAEVLQRAAVRVGLDPKGVYAHALRHAFTSWEIIHGGDLLSTQSRVGHASVRTTADTYAHPSHLPASRIPRFAWEDLAEK